MTKKTQQGLPKRIVEFNLFFRLSVMLLSWLLCVVWGLGFEASDLWFVIHSEQSGAIRSHLGAMLDCVGLSWRYAGPFYGYVGPSLGPCWPILGLCWRLYWLILTLWWFILRAPYWVILSDFFPDPVKEILKIPKF
jgi:hypothetical protein